MQEEQNQERLIALLQPDCQPLPIMGLVTHPSLILNLDSVAPILSSLSELKYLMETRIIRFNNIQALEDPINLVSIILNFLETIDPQFRLVVAHLDRMLHRNRLLAHRLNPRKRLLKSFQDPTQDSLPDPQVLEASRPLDPPPLVHEQCLPPLTEYQVIHLRNHLVGLRSELLARVTAVHTAIYPRSTPSFLDPKILLEDVEKLKLILISS